ncbi:Serine/threonine protein phosphatase 2A regulatory subunit B''beta [Porphyridium purpureum]|uniref:Serine/threonine protein phosphatase 2A regulatory subunit B''beta n=1 Tax=Porphyridium purpureum TaxID=35688 RepID=A0A5J4YYB7_PORPP|nr:Serine/threonine protein phosphatase 2A regulatory subunit B''beta [Porphyridium purpureum]|eukprot:POR5645..scf208_2
MEGRVKKRPSGITGLASSEEVTDAQVDADDARQHAQDGAAGKAAANHVAKLSVKFEHAPVDLVGAQTLQPGAGAKERGLDQRTSSEGSLGSDRGAQPGGPGGMQARTASYLLPLMSPRVSTNDARRKARLRGSDCCPNAKLRIDTLLFQWLCTNEPRLLLDAIVGTVSDSEANQQAWNLLTHERSMGKRSPTQRSHLDLPHASSLEGSGLLSMSSVGLGASLTDIGTSNGTTVETSLTSTPAAAPYATRNSELFKFISQNVGLGSVPRQYADQASAAALSPRKRMYSPLDTFATDLLDRAPSGGSDLFSEASNPNGMTPGNAKMGPRALSRSKSSKRDIKRITTARSSIDLDAVKEAPKQDQEIPPFYVPMRVADEESARIEEDILHEFFNLPMPSRAKDDDDFVEDGAEAVEEVPRNEVSRPDFAEMVVEVFGLPSFFSGVLFDRIYRASHGCAEGGEEEQKVPDEVDPDEQEIDRQAVMKFWEVNCKGRSRPARLFHFLLNGADRDYLVPGDLFELVESLLVCHPGLAFLASTPEFQKRYAETVVQRIFFYLSDHPTGKVYFRNVVHRGFLDVLMELDEEEDINRERKFFSYEHFYVLYCRFWELDQDHDLLIDREDLLRYNGHSLTCRVLDRVFAGVGRPHDCKEPGFMGYTDFVWFCLCEEDKTSRTSIMYWFRCIDLDGNGIITLDEVEYFFAEQQHRMECLGHESVELVDIVCQLFDMLKPNFQRPFVRLNDLYRNKLSAQFFNVLFNLNKFFESEAKDPMQLQQERATPQYSDWDRFAANEYMRLSQEDDGDDDDDEFEGDEFDGEVEGDLPSDDSDEYERKDEWEDVADVDMDSADEAFEAIPLS